MNRLQGIKVAFIIYRWPFLPHLALLFQRVENRGFVLQPVLDTDAALYEFKEKQKV